MKNFANFLEEFVRNLLECVTGTGLSLETKKKSGQLPSGPSQPE
jgi:hypothetical protein